MITYSTNWMGPISRRWYDLRNTSWEDGQWVGGRIDIHGLDCNEYYDGRYEYDLPIMDAESWNKFSDWLEQLKSDEFIPYEQLIGMFEAKHGKIVWASDVFEIDKEIKRKMEGL